MPLFLEPDQGFPIVLDSDMSKPIDLRPTFFAKSLSMREQNKLSSAIDLIFEDAKSTNDICDRTVEVLNRYLVGWKNMGQFEFGSDIRDFLTQQEAMQLLRKIMGNQHVQLEEKKS
jgi:hypothetical protein